MTTLICELCEQAFKRSYFLKHGYWYVCRGCVSVLMNNAIHKKIAHEKKNDTEEREESIESNYPICEKCGEPHSIDCSCEDW